MNEIACRFGRNGELGGIISEPDGAWPRTACILVSAGLVPKFGPYRLYAFLARQLAANGIVVLRFDLGGIGDSVANMNGAPLRHRTRREIAAAVAFMRSRYPHARITLAGLCSGAEDSFRYAETDPQVTGVLMIDPFSYRTRGWHWRHLRYRAVRRVLRTLGIFRPHRRGIASGAAGSDKGLVQYEYMAADESRRILSNLVGRGTRVHFMYTGGARETFNHAAQLQKMFPALDFSGLVSVDYMPRITHTQMLEADRHQIAGATLAWFSRGSGLRQDTEGIGVPAFALPRV